jgi:hypothetical protein
MAIRKRTPGTVGRKGPGGIRDASRPLGARELAALESEFEDLSEDERERALEWLAEERPELAAKLKG